MKLFIPITNKEEITMRGLRAKRVKMVKEGTLIATVDIGITNNTGYCTTLDGRSTQSEIMKLAGLDLYEISSGKRKEERRISKRSRSLLRKILF